MHHVLYEIAERHRGETVLAISHGGLMRLTLPLILTREPADPPARLVNCAVVEISVDDHHWTCDRWPPALPDGQTPADDGATHATPKAGPPEANGLPRSRDTEVTN